MPTLTKGGNTTVVGDSLNLALSWQSGECDAGIDVSALLLNDGGRVRDDNDFVFYNQPCHASGAVALHGSAGGPRTAESLEVRLGAVEGSIVRIAFVASVHIGTFSSVNNLRLDLQSPGAEMLTFHIEGCTTEAALVVGELYRRSGSWKFRAVGQGYDSGLAGVAQEFGIAVGDHSPEAAAPHSMPADNTSPSMANVVVSPRLQPVVQATEAGVTPGSSVLPWYKAKHDLSIDFATSLTVADIARTFKEVIRSKSRKAQFDAVEQLLDPFDQFNDNADFAAVAGAKDFTKMWAVQIYIYELERERGVTLRVIGESGFSRALDGFQNSFSKTAGRKKADAVIDALRRIDQKLRWLTD